MDRPVLDHLAVAVERHTDAWPTYAAHLGGAWVSGGNAIGFAPAQIRFANGMKVEVLQPHAVERSDFLRRFLDRRGPGAHHFTFKVPDIRATLAAVAQFGAEPVGVDLRDPGWQEAFLRPADACGIVVQFAEAVGEWCNPPPPGFPAPVPAHPAELVRFVHAVPDMGVGTALFAGLLGGERVDEGDRWVELAWPGTGRIRVVEDDKAGRGPGRFDHIVFALDDPAAVPGARAGPADGTWTVDPADNHGVRLVLTARRQGDEYLARR